MATFKGAKNRDDTFVGTAAADRFRFDPADLTAGDLVFGGDGAGRDTLVFTAAGAIGASALAGVSQIERIVLADGSNSIVLNDALVSTADGARLTVVGGSGDDLVYAASLTGANAINVFAGRGADVLIGGDGADTFHFSSDALDALDAVQGGGAGPAIGADTLAIVGDAPLAMDALAHVSGIEAFLISGAGMRLTLGQTIFDTAQGHRIAVIGGAGADVIDASSADVDAYDGGLTVDGGDGDDVITGAFQQPFAGHIFQAFVDGGAGRDTIDVSGTVAATVVYDASDIRVAASTGILMVDEGVNIDLSHSDDQTFDDDVVVQGFYDVDASASRESVSIIGLNYSTIKGGAAADYLANGQYITGGRGADIMIGGVFQSIFTIGLHDFAAGEVIVGQSGSDVLNVTGSVDFRNGQVSGIDFVNVRNAPGTAQPAHLTFSAEQASHFGQVFGAEFGRTAVVDIRADAPTTLNLYNLRVGYADLTVYGSTGDDVITLGSGTVHAGAGNDILSGYGRLYGDAGNDEMTYDYYLGSKYLDGGDGVDTLVGGYYANATIRLSPAADQTIGDDVIVRGFEDVDWGSNGSAIDCVGSAGANHIVGSLYEDQISGRGGNDVIEGGNGSDILSGGAGADIFRWTQREIGTDTIKDFTTGEDVLQFTKSVFDFAGERFNHLLINNGGALSVNGVDLLIYTGGRLNSSQDVATLLEHATGGDGNGIFVAGTNNAGHTVLFYTDNAGSPHSYEIDLLADLGRHTAATAITLADFSFI